MAKRFEYPDGLWIELRPPSVTANRCIQDGADFESDMPSDEHAAFIERERRYRVRVDDILAQIARHFVAGSWGDDDNIAEHMSEGQIAALLPPWQKSGVDLALPPVVAPPSTSTSPRPSSAAPTAERAPSRSRSTSSSSTSPASSASPSGN